jgi:Holliday junction resolvasome RuvABC endonuclease subunit
MKVLGCDPSLTDFGWALLDTGNTKNVVHASGRIRTKSKDFFAARYLHHRTEIHRVIVEHEPQFVGIEIPPHDASWSAGLYPIWISIAEICFQKRIPFATFLPSQIKAYARGTLGDSGKMFKSDMVDAAKSLTGISGKLNHNIADAIIIAWFAMRLKGLIDGKLTEEDLSDKEKYLLTRVVKKRSSGLVEKEGLFYKEGTSYYNLDTSLYDLYYFQDKM